MPDFDSLLEEEEERKSMHVEQSRDLDLIQVGGLRVGLVCGRGLDLIQVG